MVKMKPEKYTKLQAIASIANPDNGRDSFRHSIRSTFGS
jgi:hypothetical protein